MKFIAWVSFLETSREAEELPWEGSAWGGGGDSMDSADQVCPQHWWQTSPAPSRQPAWADHDSIKPNLILGPGAVFPSGAVNVLEGCWHRHPWKCTRDAPQLLHPYNSDLEGGSYGNNYRDRQARGSESRTGHACLLNKLRHTCIKCYF